MALTPITLKNLRPRAKGYKKHDGAGLFIFVTPSGAKSWRYRFHLGGKEAYLMLGLYSDKQGEGLGLAEARDQRVLAEALVLQGIDPRAHKKLAVAELGDRVFETFAREWVQHHVRRKALADKPMVPAHVHDILRSLEVHVFPAIGRLNVDQITSRHLALLLDKIRPARAETICGRLREIFHWAEVMNLREPLAGNPAIAARSAMGQRPKAKRMPALTTVPEVIELLRTVDASDSYRILKLATRFLALTAARPVEVTDARWEEITTDPKTGRMLWSLPASRMKPRIDFDSALSPAAVEVIEAMRPISGRFEFIFPRARNGNRPLDRASIVRLLADVGYKRRHVAHGFRTSFSTIMRERHEEERVAIEFQLSHVLKGVEGAYNRGSYLARRYELVDEYASLITPTLVSAREVLDGRLPAPLQLVRVA